MSHCSPPVIVAPEPNTTTICSNSNSCAAWADKLGANQLIQHYVAWNEIFNPDRGLGKAGDID
jgi:hypothetical protein